MRRNVYSTCDSQLPNGKRFVAVNLLSEDTLYFVVEVKSKANELFVQICKFLGLSQTELFGLAIITDSVLFLDPTQRLCKYAPKQWKQQNNGVDNTGKSLFGVHLRVQFYVDSFLYISDKVAKLLYYLQLRENVVNYGQPLCEERAFLLASYALQADFGNFNAEQHIGQYFNANQYFAFWVIEAMGLEYIVRHLPFLHRDHKAMSKSEAQSMYIKEASDASAPHNMHLYRLKNKTASAEVWLGICTTGVEINSEEQRISSIHNSSHTCAKQKTRISYFSWPDIGKLYFEKKKFEIRSTRYPIRKFTYYASTEDMARHLLWLCKVTHQFQLVVQSKMKEVKRRESELCRKKFRESYIYDNSYDLPIIGRNSNKNDSAYSEGTTSEDTCAQRISVISNTSSTTTSGIVSDKVQSLEDSNGEDVEIMIDMAPVVSPVVSLESLALSEPIDSSTRRMPAVVDDKQSNSFDNITMSCNSYQSKQRTDNDVPSSANSIKSTSSERSNTTVKSVVPSNNRQIIHILNKLNDNIVLKDLNQNNPIDMKTAGALVIANPTSTSLEQKVLVNNLSAKTLQPDLTVHSVNMSNLSSRSESMNHIYENIPYFQQFNTQSIKPKPVLRACPSLSSTLTPTTTTNTNQRITPRIGVSSLTRTHNKPKLSIFSYTLDQNSIKNLSIAASEPNLHTSQLWSSPNHSPNRTQLHVTDESTNPQLNTNSYKSINGLSDTIGAKVTNGYNPQMIMKANKEWRTHSDPCAQYTRPSIKPLIPYSCPTKPHPCPKSCIESTDPSIQPSFHQSLNNISMTSSPQTLRLFGSDINVNTDNKLQSLLLPPPPPQYASPCINNRVIKSANISQLTTNQKGNSLITTNGRLNTNSEQNGSISDLQQLRQKSRDLNLPLITALFNDRSLMMLPKTVPGSRQRHISTARDIRRYSCSSDICADISYKHISAFPSPQLDSDLPLPKVSLNNRPTSWHIECPNMQNIWEQYPNHRSPGTQYMTTTADFIDRLWAEHHLDSTVGHSKAFPINRRLHQ